MDNFYFTLAWRPIKVNKGIFSEWALCGVFISDTLSCGDSLWVKRTHIENGWPLAMKKGPCKNVFLFWHNLLGMLLMSNKSVKSVKLQPLATKGSHTKIEEMGLTLGDWTTVSQIIYFYFTHILTPLVI